MSAMQRLSAWAMGLLLVCTTGCQVHGNNEKTTGGTGDMIVYIGTYTGPKSQGIYMTRIDAATGALTTPQLAGEVKNPSFLTIHPNHKYLYAVGELSEFQGKKTGAVSAFSIDPASGKLTLINQQSSGGDGPCFVSADKEGRNALVANYGGGSVECIPIKPDGSLATPTSFIQHTGSSVDPARQKEPHAHSINVTPDGRLAIAADLGLDKLLIYNVDADRGTLTPGDPPFAKTPPGGGPRHLAFSPNGKYAYIINEMGCSVTAFAYDAAKGTLTEVQTLSALPGEKSPKYSGAEVQVHPSGKFVYASIRGLDMIAIFKADESTGKLTPAGHAKSGGQTPRNFRIDPTGTFLLTANQGTGNVVVYRIDPKTGNLTPTGASVDVASACCIKFLPTR
jgi:6-phosphogluconolactonase